MRRFLLGVLLLPAVALAQPVTVDKKVPCDNAARVIKELTEKYEETPIWFGTAKEGKVALLINKTTGSWTVLQYNKDIACILEIGEEFQLRQGSVSGKDV